MQSKPKVFDSFGMKSPNPSSLTEWHDTAVFLSRSQTTQIYLPVYKRNSYGKFINMVKSAFFFYLSSYDSDSRVSVYVQENYNRY